MKKWGKRIFYFFLGIFIFLLILILLLQTRWAKNLLRDKLQAYISKKTNTEFVIASIDYSLPKWVEMNGVFMRDLSKDTLLYGRQIKVDIAMLKLITGKYQVDRIVLDDIYINLTKKEHDTVFNYQFIADAFKSKTTDAKQEDSTSTLNISIRDIRFINTRFNQLDYNAGSLMKLYAGQLHLKMNDLDLNNMHFDIDRLFADSINFNMQITKPQPVIASSNKQTILPILKVDSIIIKNSIVFFDNRPVEVYTNNYIGLLQAANLNNKKSNNTFTGTSFVLAKSNIQFRHSTKEQAIAVKNDTLKATVSQGHSMNFILDEIDLNNNNITYDNTAKPVKESGLDYFHLGITDLILTAQASRFVDGNIQSNIQRFSFKDRSGFKLDSLSGYVRMDSSTIGVQKFVLRTPSSFINADVMFYTASLGSNSTRGSTLPEDVIVLNKTIIGKKDLDLLAEGLTEKFKQQLDEMGNLVVDANIKGNKQRFYIQKLTLNATTPNAFNLQMSGTIDNLTDTKNLRYNTNIQNLTVSQKLLSPFVNKNEQRVSLPPIINLKGTVSGTTNNVNANVTTNSAYGFAAIKANVSQFANANKMEYDIAVNAKDLETGKWIGKDSVLGKLNGNITVKGNNGFDVKNNNLKVVAAIKSVRYKQSIIDNVNANVVLKNGQVQGTGFIADELIGLQLSGTANIHNQYPTVDATVNVANADLLALGLTKDTLNITAFTKIKVDDATPKNLNAIVRMDSVVIKKDGENIAFDSATIIAFVKNDSTILQLAAPFADVKVASTVYYNDIPALLQEAASQFFPASTKDSISNTAKSNKSSAKGAVHANIIIKPHETYNAFVKKMTVDGNININANITNKSKDSAVTAQVDLPGLQMNTLRIANLKGDVVGHSDSLKLNIVMDTLKAGNLLLYDATVKGGFSKKNITATVATKDADKKDNYQLTIAAKPNNEQGYDINLQKELLLNKQTWTVNQQNVIRTTSNGFNIQQFEISNGNQKLAVHNETASTESPIIVDINNFKLSTVTSALDKDSLQLEAMINVDAKISDLKNAIPTMDGTVKVDSVMYQNMNVGNLNLKAQSANSNVTVTGKLLGNGNNVDVSGNYNAEKIDVKVNLNPISISSIDPFTKGNITRSKGTITGPITITGSAISPQWNGELTFNNVQTTAKAFGTFIGTNNQKLVFNYPTITLNNFTITDSTNVPLKINGTLTQDKEDGFKADLSLNTKGFHAMDNTAVDNTILYGKAMVDIDATITGNVLEPEIAGNVSIKNGTQVTFVRQYAAPSAKDREGVMEFVNMDTITNLLSKRTYEEVLALQKKEQSGGLLNYNLNLEVEQEAKFNVIIDPITRDELEVQGKAEINMGVTPSGSTALTGTYYLKKGSYQLNYQFIKRKFLLLDGSTITLSGDPKKAIADITAAYEINTPAIDLVGNEISGTTSVENNIYKRKTPFQVLLRIKGEVMKPELSFDIVLKDKAEGISYEMATTIDNKLEQLRTDPSAMNKQVFALLVMNRFIGEQSRDFFAGNGSNNNLLANESVSGFLNGAINQIAADLVKGIDIDVNLKNVDDDPNAIRTDLNVALSKNFIDDRLNVSVGKSFTVEGTDPSANSRNRSNNNVQFIPDVNTTYKLSKDGRFMIRAYRRNQYEALLDGYFIETGVAFSFTADYDKLMDLFKKRKG